MYTYIRTCVNACEGSKGVDNDPKLALQMLAKAAGQVYM